MADYIYLIPSGQIIPDTSVVQAQVIAEFKVAFGSNLNTDPSTPQGMLINMETLSRIAVLENNAQLANQQNPNLAGGVALDSIMALTGLERVAQQFSTVSANLAGVPGSIIGTSAQAQETVNGQIFQLTAAVTLSVGGTGVGVFQALNPGPVSAAPGTLTKIISGAVGWETVTNPDAATLGQLTQSDIAARGLRLVTIGIQGSSLAKAILGALALVSGVTSAVFRENFEDVYEVIDGVNLKPHSMYACVQGGLDADIANALVSKKSGGCNYNGNTSVVITQPFSGQVMTILYDRPEIILIMVRATVKTPPNIQDPTNLVKQAILDYANGLLNNEPGLKIGVSVSAFELAGAVNIEQPTIYVSNMEISVTSPLNFSNATIAIGINQIALIQSSSITVLFS